MHTIKLSGYKVGIKFDKHRLAVEQNNYTNKIVNAYIAYDLDAWLGNPTNSFKFKNCSFGATTIAKNSNIEEWVYNGYGIVLDRAGSWNFGNDFPLNAVIFGVNNSSSSHADSHKNNFLVLGEGPTYGINGSYDLAEKKFSINFSKTNTKFGLSLHYNGHNSLLMEKKSLMIVSTTFGPITMLKQSL